MSDHNEPRTEAGPSTRRWLIANGYFSWGGDAWIHEDEEGTVMSTLDAVDDCARRTAEAGAAPSVDERHYPNDNCGNPDHDRILEAWYARAEGLLDRVDELDVDRLALSWFVGIQARFGIDRDTATRRWNATSDPDVEHLHKVYGDVAAKAAAEYRRLSGAPQEGTDE